MKHGCMLSKSPLEILICGVIQWDFSFNKLRTEKSKPESSLIFAFKNLS